MSEQFILDYVSRRMEQLGYSKYHIRYRDILIGANSERGLSAYNELFFIVGDPEGVSVESDYGVYDSTNNPSPENMHQHRGEIIIINSSDSVKRIKFIQVIIVN